MVRLNSFRLYAGEGGLGRYDLNMNDAQEEQKIHGVIDTWMRASAENDLQTVLSLMAEDVVFLLPGRAPLIGRAAFAAASAAMAGKVKFEGKPQIQEVRILGDYAICWNHLSITATPVDGGKVVQREGDVLSIFRKEPDGHWVLFRDANLLAAKSPTDL
jgi:uncharacterized protein (TIGR02246 family)